MKLQILQLKNKPELRDYSFTPMWMLEKHGMTVNLDNYKKIYSDDSFTSVYERTEDILEGIFCKFQCNKPENYKGHSLSVSDIVVLDGVNYFVDSIGFVKL